MQELQSLDDIFTKKIFRIPDYQRGYAWGEKQLTEFWEDLISLGNHRSHYTGVISIKEVPQITWSLWNDEKWLIEGRKFKAYYVVDGQQRLTTVSIFLQCLIESVRNHPSNDGLSEDDIFLGQYPLKEIREKYVVITEPRNRVINTYKFGYDTDNPSFDFLRHKIFCEPNAGTLKETFYTLNLENAKLFFKENVELLVQAYGLGALEPIFEKLTQRFLFNLYEIDENFDVFVAFETMNNRGKRLSDLELLKNRLIYLTTLYSPLEVDESTKEATRKNINDTWGEVYNQLGRNKLSPLNDDEFLRAHWIMYFKYSRNTGSDYIRFLLDDYFSPKNILENFDVSTKGIAHVTELSDEFEAEDDENEAEENHPLAHSKRSISEINAYVNSLKVAAKAWYSSFFPKDSDDLTAEEQLLMDKINRVKVGYFRPLIMSAILVTEKDCQNRRSLFKEIERFIFINFRLCRSQSNSGSSHFYRCARELQHREGQRAEPKTIANVISELKEHINWAFNEDGTFKANYFRDFIAKKYSGGGSGFYGWNDLRYFLFEYEEELKLKRGQPKIGWDNFIKSSSDKISIEHIYPQTASEDYWCERFAQFTEEQRMFLKGSLGNLLPLSSSINSSLQNDAFPAKKTIKKNAQGQVVRNGYENGAYSEIEVAQELEWTATQVERRGLRLLDFMEQRWQLNLGSEEEKLDLLHLSFLRDVLDGEELSDLEAEEQ